MIPGNPCFIGIMRKYDRNGNEIEPSEWYVFFDETEAKKTLDALSDAAGATGEVSQTLLGLHPGTMFLPDRSKAN